jgi:hypothetical protein
MKSLEVVHSTANGTNGDVKLTFAIGLAGLKEGRGGVVTEALQQRGCAGLLHISTRVEADDGSLCLCKDNIGAASRKS